MTALTLVKFATIHARAVYPPVSAWEFKSLKTEAVVRDRLANSTIYLIVQRPMLWFHNVVPRGSDLFFDIMDGSGKCIHCKFDPRAALGLATDADIEVEYGFHRDAEQDQVPFGHVASIRVYRGTQFLAWWSPHKMLFESSTLGLPLLGDGDVHAFTDYDVHYVGQAFSQKVWDRLAAHPKLQSVLTSEFIRGEEVKTVALEVSLITLEIVDVSETVLDAAMPFVLPAAFTPIVHRLEADLSDESLDDFIRPWMAPGDAAVTNELEAMLIEMFDPTYNEVKFKIYPNIKSGARSKGYSYTDVSLADFPFRLRDRDGNEPLLDA